MTGSPSEVDADATREIRAVTHRWSVLSKASRILLAAGAAMLLVMVASVALATWQAYWSALSEARQDVGKLGMAIAEQTARSIQAVDIMLESIKADIANAGIDTPERFRTELGSLALQQDLLRRDAMMPQVDAFSIIDADGGLVNFSRRWPIPPTDLSDRDYFRHFKERDDPGVFVSRPVQNRGNGEWTVYLVRRVTSRSGQLLGLVLGSVDLSYFKDFYKALTVGAGTTVTLLQQDGTALTSFPTTAPIGEELPLSSAWREIVARRKQDSFTTPGVLAPGLRLVSVHPLIDYPLVVNVSLSEWEILAGWRRVAVAAAMGTACAVLCVALLLWALMLQLERLEMTKRMLERQTKRLQLSEADLAEKSTALETTLEHMNQGIIMVDSGQSVAVCNTRAVEMLGLPADLVRSRPLLKDLVAYSRDVLEPLDGETRTSASTFERKLCDGRILEVQTVPLAAGGTVETFTDITDRRMSEERIRYFAHHDNLTKLVNRLVFQERLEHAIELADRTCRQMAVLCLDLDGFKQVNDGLGHSAGDELLVEVAVRLSGAARESDTVARMGGDEFAIIQPIIDQPDASAGLAKRLIDVIGQPFHIEGDHCSVGVSIGIAFYPDDARTGRELLINADKALYRAKADGRNRFRAFSGKLVTPS